MNTATEIRQLWFIILKIKNVVYDEGVKTKQNMIKWDCELKKGRTEVYDEERNGRPSAISDKMLPKIKENIYKDQCLIFDELHEL